MSNFYNNLKRELSEMSSENIMITVSRKDLESLMKAYERLLEKKNDWDTKDTRDYSRVFFYLVVLSDKILHRKTSKFFCLLSTAFGTHKKSDKMKVCKGLKVEIFWVVFSKNTTCPLRIFKRWHESKSPFAEVAEVRFFCFFFLWKKRKVLMFLSDLSDIRRIAERASQTAHFT